ncbi:hypothetical protein BV898_10049 [Hypsibius exemplaris]|uniref:Uncharacterized protein n=1 Tax=Hypsibius exemplaris TaxID=2072580 RepID=A0A1W0WKV8_HYPEX|nr:hypothetical protein BV898_10049 [Hypsibius exemplaris]
MDKNIFILVMLGNRVSTDRVENWEAFVKVLGDRVPTHFTGPRNQFIHLFRRFGIEVTEAQQARHQRRRSHRQVPSRVPRPPGEAHQQRSGSSANRVSEFEGIQPVTRKDQLRSKENWPQRLGDSPSISG